MPFDCNWIESKAIQICQGGKYHIVQLLRDGSENHLEKLTLCGVIADNDENYIVGEKKLLLSCGKNSERICFKCLKTMYRNDYVCGLDLGDNSAYTVVAESPPQLFRVMTVSW